MSQNHHLNFPMNITKSLQIGSCGCNRKLSSQKPFFSKLIQYIYSQQQMNKDIQEAL